MTSAEYQQLVEFLGQRFVAIGHHFDGMDRRFDALEQRVETGFHQVFGHFDAIYACLDRLEQQCAESAVIVRRIEAMLVRDRAA